MPGATSFCLIHHSSVQFAVSEQAYIQIYVFTHQLKKLSVTLAIACIYQWTVNTLGSCYVSTFGIEYFIEWNDHLLNERRIPGANCIRLSLECSLCGPQRLLHCSDPPFEAVNIHLQLFFTTHWYAELRLFVKGTACKQGR